MDFLLIIHKKYEKNLFIEYIINNYNSTILFYNSFDLESMSIEKILEYIDTVNPQYVFLDEYELLYPSIRQSTSSLTFLVKLDNRKMEFIEDKINLILFNKYEVSVIQRLYPNTIDKVYCFEDFQLNYDKIDRTLLFAMQRTTSINEFLNGYTVSEQFLLSEKFQSFFANIKQFSFEYALNILLRSSIDIQNNIAMLYESLVYYSNILKDLEELEETNLKIKVFSPDCSFLPYKYTSNISKNIQISELLYTNKILVLPKYSNLQIEQFIDRVCEALFIGSFVFIHEENKIFIDYFSFRSLGTYSSLLQIPTLLGSVKLNPQEVRYNKRLILQFENQTSLSVEKSLKLLDVNKNEQTAYIKPYMFKDTYKLLNIFFKNESISGLSSFITPKFGTPKGLLVDNLVIDTYKEVEKKLSFEVAEKVCFFNREHINVDSNSLLSKLDIYYYGNSLEKFNIKRTQLENETYVTSSLYLLEYFQSQNLQSLLDITYEDYNITNTPTKQITTYIHIHDNEKEYKRIYENTSIKEESKQELSKYITNKTKKHTHIILHEMSEDREIQSIFNSDSILYSRFINKIIDNHHNTQVALVATKINELDIYGNKMFLYSVMDSVRAFCCYKHDLDTIVPFLNTIGEYKFFIYPSNLCDYNLSFIMTILVSLKKTYVILPVTLRESMRELGIETELFSFYHSSSDIVEIYRKLEDDTKRVEIIELYLEAIRMNKMYCNEL